MKHNGPHKYARRYLGIKKRPIYQCEIAGCSHYILAELLHNKLSLCWKCNEPFIISKLQARAAKPKCGCDKELKIDPAVIGLDELRNHIMRAAVSDLYKDID